MLGVGERRVGRVLVAEHQPERDIAVLVVVPDFRCTFLGGVFEIDHHRQRFILHLDQFGGVARLRQRLGGHERDPVADITHPVRHENRLPGAVALRGAEILRHRMGGERTQLLGGRIRAGQHAEHAGRGLGLGGIDALDLGVGVWGEHRDAVAHAGQADVVDVVTLAHQEALILDAAYRLPNAELGCHLALVCSIWWIRPNLGERGAQRQRLNFTICTGRRECSSGVVKPTVTAR